MTKQDVSLNTTNNPVKHEPQLQAPIQGVGLSVYQRVLGQPLNFGTLASPNLQLSAEGERLAELMTATLLPEHYGDFARDFARAWIAALENSGTLSCYPETTYREYTLEIEGKNFPALTFEGYDPNKRVQDIKSTRPYISRGQMGEAKNLLDLQGCQLCTSIAQALDAAVDPEVPSNALCDLGDYLWIVNKFPCNLGDTLILPKTHDDMSGRVTPRQITPSEIRYSIEEGKTRNKVLTPTYLETVMAVCDRFKQQAKRNHVLCGMSQPMHDHFKLKPEQNPGASLHRYFYQADKGLNTTVDLYRPTCAAFDVLALACADREELARTLVDLLEHMERAHEIYTITYFQGHWFILPRKKEAIGETPIRTGSTVNCHIIDDPAKNPLPLKEVLRTVPLKEEFQWAKYLTTCSASLIRQDLDEVLAPELTKAQALVFCKYEPVDYHRAAPWGMGANLERLESWTGTNVTDAYYTSRREGCQDTRHDKGHTEFAAYATAWIGRLSGLNYKDLEAAVLAAVVHDTGYAFIPNVSDRYDRITSGRISPDPEQQRLALEDDAAIRREHQAASVEYAQILLSGHPQLERIIKMVADHDTRLTAPDLATQCFWDGDWLARVSAPTVNSIWKQVPALYGDIPRTIALLEEQLTFNQPEGLFTPVGYAMARLEFVNTALHLVGGRLDKLPPSLPERYGPELAKLASRRHASQIFLDRFRSRGDQTQGGASHLSI
jgi:hypothetical protein